jgi:hypothetical protein
MVTDKEQLIGEYFADKNAAGEIFCQLSNL